MCGIAGIWHRDGRPVSPQMISAMTDVQSHRGPDDRGTYVSGDVALGHRRLAIIDLTETGHQPMSNRDGTLWITYNGEVYNYVELRAELEGRGARFRSTSDTEVLIAAYEQWGESCVERFNGIFSFAIWDSRRQTLFCARDRFGVKPFHFAEIGPTFLFASEPKGVLASGIVPRGPDWRVVYRYLVLNLLNVDNNTFFSSIQKLPPAHTLTVHRDGGSVLRRYWDIPTIQSGEQRSDAEWLEEYEATLEDSVRLQMRSDVPVGVCLSGGLDSTSITRIATEFSSIPTKTFTAFLPHPLYDEREPVSAFTRLMNGKTEPHFVSPELDTWVHELPKVVYHHDEPHAGYIAATQWEVMRLVHQRGVKVVLDGQGSDETLGGYNFFVESAAADLVRSGRVLEAFRILSLLEDRRGTGYAAGARRLIKVAGRAFFSRDHLFEIEGRWNAAGLPLSRDWCSRFRRFDIPTIEATGSRLDDDQRTAMFVTMLPYLLTFEDRASMAFSIESRVPFLDHHLVETALRLPRHLRVDGTTTKVALRRIMEGKLPREIVNARLKRVFGTPYEHWFSEKLSDFARDILTSQAFLERPFIEKRKVPQLIASFPAAARSRRKAFNIWNLVNLELWFRVCVEQNADIVAN